MRPRSAGLKVTSRSWTVGLAILGLAYTGTETEIRAQVVPGSTRSVSLRGEVYAWSPDGSLLAYAIGDTITILEGADFDRVRCRIRAAGVRPPIQQISWSPAGSNSHS